MECLSDFIDLEGLARESLDVDFVRDVVLPVFGHLGFVDELADILDGADKSALFLQGGVFGGTGLAEAQCRVQDLDALELGERCGHGLEGFGLGLHLALHHGHEFCELFVGHGKVLSDVTAFNIV